MVIGIAGGVGSGKSTVLEVLRQEYDACICMADELGHLAMSRGTDAYREIIREFGSSILCGDGEIDRNALAGIVYFDDNRLRALNSIIHPYVIREISRQIEECHKELFVLETAILFETGCDSLCDEIWGVITEDEIRIQRLIRSRGYSREKAESIMKNQLSNGELAKRCDCVLVNDGDVMELREQLRCKLEEIHKNVVK